MCEADDMLFLALNKGEVQRHFRQRKGDMNLNNDTLNANSLKYCKGFIYMPKEHVTIWVDV